MAFSQASVDTLLARTGRMCAICNRRHGVQVHHILPTYQGGDDDESNAIPLCPNCHDEVHAGYAPGRVTRTYTERELRGHLERTIELAERASHLTRGDEDWIQDVELLEFFAGCLDRPAFRTWFHNELSFADFDQALEDTVLALNTGMWRTRDGTTIERARGKRHLVNATWRDQLDSIVGQIDEARRALRRGLSLDKDLMHLRHGDRWIDRYDDDLRGNRQLGAEIDQLRQAAIEIMNEVLEDAGRPTLKRLEEWN